MIQFLGEFSATNTVVQGTDVEAITNNNGIDMDAGGTDAVRRRRRRW